MSAREVRRAALRGALVAVLGLAFVLAWGALRGRAPTLALLATAATAGAAMLPLMAIEAAAARLAAAGRSYEAFVPAWLTACIVAVLLWAEHVYVAALTAGRGLDASLAAALDGVRAFGGGPGGMALLVAGWALLPVGSVVSMRVRGPDAYGPGALTVAALALPLLCLEPVVYAASVLVAPVLLGVYTLADRLERGLRRWRDREAISALRARVRSGEVALERVRLLAHLGDEVACGALGYADPDDSAPDPEAWAKGLLPAGPRLVARAAAAAAACVGARVEGGQALVDALDAVLAAPDAEAAAAPAQRAREAAAAWSEADDPGRRALVEAVHAVVEGRGWCGIDAVRAAILATGDVEQVRAAVRAAVLPHVDGGAPEQARAGLAGPPGGGVADEDEPPRARRALAEDAPH